MNGIEKSILDRFKALRSDQINIKKVSIGSAGCRLPAIVLVCAFVAAACPGCGGAGGDDGYRSSEGESPPANVTGTFSGDDKIEGSFGGDCTTDGTFVLERQAAAR